MYVSIIHDLKDAFKGCLSASICCFFLLCGDFWKPALWYKRSKTCVSIFLHVVNNEESQRRGLSCQRTLWVTFIGCWMRNTGCALMCPFISLSTVITTDAFLYQLSASAPSHRKHGCLTAVLMSLCVCLCYVRTYYMLQYSPFSQKWWRTEI